MLIRICLLHYIITTTIKAFFKIIAGFTLHCQNLCRLTFSLLMTNHVLYLLYYSLEHGILAAFMMKQDIQYYKGFLFHIHLNKEDIKVLNSDSALLYSSARTG